ncbi:MAG: STAS/SEC14 domain-containing protein [Rhodothermales bacterium]|nr:STAS/SEC14 domain-containing protein [Rhodothermales bacterium]
MEDWHGWDSLSALWEDLKTDLHLNDQVERLAMVGDENWHKWTAMLTTPFAKGTVRYFNRDQFEDAWAWVQGSQND